MHTKKHRRNQGFSLVEVMIGMVMGMIVLLVIMQAFSVAEGYKRTTTTGSDSQINGLMALRTLESEVRMAGYGMTNTASLCPSIKSINPATGNIATPPINNMPVKIVDGGTGPDTIEIVYSSSSTGAAPTRITVNMPTPSNATFVSSTTGYAACDFILYASKDGSKVCALQQATDTFASPAKILTSSGQSNYNPNGGAVEAALFPSGGYSTSDIVINMGQYIDRRFSVNKTASKDEYFLRQTKVNSAADGCSTADPNPDLDLISNIVNIQAQYGVAPIASQQVNCWTGAATTDTGCTITGGDNWSAPPIADAKRIKAVRVAIVARSALSEKPSTGSTCNTTTTAPISWDGGPVIDLTSVPNWQCYRYKVYQTVIPLINVMWANT